MRLHLDGKAFIVTAASAGLGFATAQALVSEGAGVVLVARDERRLMQSVELLGGTQHAFGLVGDVTDPELATRAVETTLDCFGSLDGGFISVGGPPPGAVLDIDDETWTSSFSGVFLPALRFARAIYGHNEAATMGFVLSTSSKAPLANMAPSNGLRPGLAMLVKQLANEVGPDGGRAFGLMPGSISTDRITSLLRTRDDPKAALADMEAGIPLRRLGTPAEFGAVAAFLMSDAASYMTGCIIPVDGGALPTF